MQRCRDTVGRWGRGDGAGAMGVVNPNGAQILVVVVDFESCA